MASPIRATELKPHHRIEFLNRLRCARDLVLKDAEAFNEAAASLEFVGQIMQGRQGNGLGSYLEEIVSLATSRGDQSPEEVRRLFNIVKDARNDAVHDGAYVRHMSTRLVDLILMLEHAVMAGLNRVGDVMVRSPVSAEPWQLVSHVRRLMLENSYSNIPMLIANEESKLFIFLTDTHVMNYLHPRTSTESRKERLSNRINEALGKGLQIEPAKTCPPTELVENIVPLMTHYPMLVTESQGGEERLVGIISAFDLL